LEVDLTWTGGIAGLSGLRAGLTWTCGGLVGAAATGGGIFFSTTDRFCGEANRNNCPGKIGYSGG